MCFWKQGFGVFFAGEVGNSPAAYAVCVRTPNHLGLREEKGGLDSCYWSVSIINLNLGESSVDLRKLFHVTVGKILSQMYPHEA